MTKGYLYLETGEVFEGEWIGADKEISGELVFNTSMTGYQEMMTDPSYAGQILTFSYPIIGSYGINCHDHESAKIAVAAVILNDLCDEPSHFQSQHTFSCELEKAGIPGLKNIDTRSLVASIRKHHTVRGKISKSGQLESINWSLDQLKKGKLVESVAVKEIERFGNEKGPHIAVIDFGYKKSIVDALLAEGCLVTVVPYSYSFNQIMNLTPDGVLISNGPGDPMEMEEHFEKIRHITENYPTLGICLGHQLIALAYGAKTRKMLFGHRGGNHPVKDLTTGKVSMTSQNHGYEVQEETLDLNAFRINFKNVNDKSVEGIAHHHLPVQSVQFHPEAHPGPSDTAYIFNQFMKQVVSSGGAVYVEA